MTSSLQANFFSFSWELPLMEWLQTHVPAGIIGAMSHLSLLGDETPLVLLLGLIFWCFHKELGKRVGKTVLVGLIAGCQIKNIVLRARPYLTSDRIKMLRPVDSKADLKDVAAQGYSFPSSHSTTSVAAYWTIGQAVSHKAAKVVLMVIPILVGISRIFVGAHFPTDVLVGWLLGMVSVWFLPWLEEKLSPNVLRVVLLLIALPGLFYCRTNDYFTTFGLYVGFFFLVIPFEEKFVNFRETHAPVRVVVRTVVGAVIFLLSASLLKLPFSAEFLEGGSRPALLYRSFRYMVALFVAFGLYPMVFRFTDSWPLWNLFTSKNGAHAE